jgi:hypothetical protein
MKFWKEELAQVEAAALRVEALEREAEKRFDIIHAEALARGGAELSLDTPELAAWLAARAETDAAWGRWAQVMDASLDVAQGDSGKA